jgi:uncharacterized membrane protein
MNITLLQTVVLLAALLCSLVAGFLFAFAVVVMPGIGTLEDGDFIRAFQAVDRVIQRNQPLFVMVWVGSVLALVTAAVLGGWQLGGADRLLVIAAALVYVLGVQVPTITVNIPLNNELQKLDAGIMTAMVRSRARENFEPRWTRWNAIRSAWASLASGLLMALLLRM